GRGRSANRRSPSPSDAAPGDQARPRPTIAPAAPTTSATAAIAGPTASGTTSAPTAAGEANSAAARNVPVSDRASPCSSVLATSVAMAGDRVVVEPAAAPPTTRSATTTGS